MNTKRIFRAAGMFLAAVVNGFGQSTNTGSDATPESVTGTPGVATQRAVMNFSELARQEALCRSNTPPAGAVSTASVTNDWTGAPAGRLYRGDMTQTLQVGQEAELSVRSMKDSADADPPLIEASASDGPLGPLTDSPSPASSFPSLESTTEEGVPDTHGAVGPDHVMATHNVRIRIQNRFGDVISTVQLTNFWAGVGPFVADPQGCPVCDSKVFYQPFDQRWIIVSLSVDIMRTNSALLIGVSQTADPTGNWNLYHFDPDPAKLVWLDYPNVGFNKDWIAVQGHIIRRSNGALLRSDIFVFNKTNLYSGGLGKFMRLQRMDQGSRFSRLTQPAATYDATDATLYLLGQVDNSGGRNLNQLRISTITGPVGAEVYTLGPVLTSPLRWDNLSAGGFVDFAPQLGSTRKIDIIDAVVLSLVYRNGSLWAVQNIFLPAGGAPSRTSIQWWQITPTGTILQRGLIDDPSGQHFYGYPTVAVNKFNDVLIGYSRFGSNQYASANYSFRAHNDLLNTIRSDTVLKAGEAPYDLPIPHNRWGDYSQTVVDPANDLDLWTIQEYAATPAGANWRWGTWWARLMPYHPPVAVARVFALFQTSANYTNLVVLSANGTNATALFDGSLSSDVDNDALQYFWFEQGDTNALATGVVATNILAVGSHTILLVVSDGILTDTNAVSVEVITTAQAVERLQAAANSDVLHSQPLIAVLSAAIAAIDRSNPTAAINQLLAFQNQVCAQVSPLNAALAATFVQAAQEVIDLLSGENTTPVGRPHARFTSVNRQSNGRVQMQFSAEPGRLHVIEASTNLSDWETLGVATVLGDDSYEFEDKQAASFSKRFYRVRLLP